MIDNNLYVYIIEVMLDTKPKQQTENKMKQAITQAKYHSVKATHYSFINYNKSKRQYHLDEMIKIMYSYQIQDLDKF